MKGLIVAGVAGLAGLAGVVGLTRRHDGGSRRRRPRDRAPPRRPADGAGDRSRQRLARGCATPSGPPTRPWRGRARPRRTVAAPAAARRGPRDADGRRRRPTTASTTTATHDDDHGGER